VWIVFIFVFVCRLNQSQIASTLANFLAPASDCTENKGLLVAQALLQLTAKLAQQANSLSSVKMLWLTAHSFAAHTGYYKRKLACFYRQHCPLEACLPMAFFFFFLSFGLQGNCPPSVS